MKIYCLLIAYNMDVCINKIKSISNFGLIPIVFDNSSNLEIRNYNYELCQKNNILYETFEKNVGLAKAYNHAITKFLSDDDWLMILDQDTEVSENYYQKVVDACKSSSSLAYFAKFRYGKNRIGPKVIVDYSKDKVCNVNTPYHQKGFLIGINSCSVFNCKLFKKIGLYEEKLFIDYVDNDICFRMAQKGIESETIDAEIVQKFFSKEKNSFKNVKKRYQNQKHDARTFYSLNYFNHKFLMFFHYLKEIYKFALLYSLHNSILWFLPLLLCKPKSLDSNE